VSRRPPSLDRLLAEALDGESRPPAFVLAGHNGSGKSTLWYERLANKLHLPLINADRLTASILPQPDAESGQLPTWAQSLRDDDERWQRLSQQGARAFKRSTRLLRWSELSAAVTSCSTLATWPTGSIRSC
jgi:gluconate kinase